MPVGHRAGDLHHLPAVGAGVVAQQVEGGAIVEAVALHQDSLRPLDHGPALERGLELLDLLRQLLGLGVASQRNLERALERLGHDRADVRVDPLLGGGGHELGILGVEQRDDRPGRVLGDLGAQAGTPRGRPGPPETAPGRLEGAPAPGTGSAPVCRARVRRYMPAHDSRTPWSGIQNTHGGPPRGVRVPCRSTWGLIPFKMVRPKLSPVRSRPSCSAQSLRSDDGDQGAGPMPVHEGGQGEPEAAHGAAHRAHEEADVPEEATHELSGVEADEADAAAERAREASELFSQMQAGDPNARDALVERFLPLARQLARRYQRAAEPLDGLVQVASIGLVKALDRFDPARGVAFSSYAVPTILGELKRYFRDSGWAVHVPRGMQERVMNVNQAMTRLSKDLGHSPTASEVAEALGENPEDVLEAMEAAIAYDAVSLDAPSRSTDDEHPDTYADSVGVVDDRYELVEYAAAIAPTVRALPERDRLVLHLRFDEDLTQLEIAERIGVSQMHVSRLIRRALTRLRTVANANG